MANRSPFPRRPFGLAAALLSAGPAAVSCCGAGLALGVRRANGRPAEKIHKVVPVLRRSN